MENIKLIKTFEHGATTYYLDKGGRHFQIFFTAPYSCFGSIYSAHELDNNNKIIGFCGRYIARDAEQVAEEIVKKYKL